jgi:hypothetical protein
MFRAIIWTVSEVVQKAVVVPVRHHQPQPDMEKHEAGCLRSVLIVASDEEVWEAAVMLSCCLVDMGYTGAARMLRSDEVRLKMKDEAPPVSARKRLYGGESRRSRDEITVDSRNGDAALLLPFCDGCLYLKTSPQTRDLSRTAIKHRATHRQ